MDQGQPLELVPLSTAETEKAKNIYQTLIRINIKRNSYNDVKDLFTYCYEQCKEPWICIYFIYLYGKISGKREERAKRNQRKLSNPTLLPKEE